MLSLWRDSQLGFDRQPGRYWGISGRSNIPWAKEKLIELRPLKRRSLGVLLVTYAGDESPTPHSASGEVLATRTVRGSYARWRFSTYSKGSPKLKMFEHLPPKLRLKNNRNVNVFWDSAFWKEGLVRLLYGGSDPVVGRM